MIRVRSQRFGAAAASRTHNPEVRESKHWIASIIDIYAFLCRWKTFLMFRCFCLLFVPLWHRMQPTMVMGSYLFCALNMIGISYFDVRELLKITYSTCWASKVGYLPLPFDYDKHPNEGNILSDDYWLIDWYALRNTRFSIVDCLLMMSQKTRTKSKFNFDAILYSCYKIYLIHETGQFFLEKILSYFKNIWGFNYQLLAWLQVIVCWVYKCFNW